MLRKLFRIRVKAQQNMPEKAGMKWMETLYSWWVQPAKRLLSTCDSN
jgi:hypothetical protein